MIHSANRSRLFELRHDRVAASRSVELLEQKREVLLHEIAQRITARDALRKDVNARYAAAHAKLHEAVLDAGRHAIGAASLAQEPRCSIAKKSLSVMGVSLLQLTVDVEPFRATYGTAGTTQSMDDAGRAFRELIADLVRLAEQEQAVNKLTISMRKTTRLLNALDKVILPGIDREIRLIVEGLEEEERDESARSRWRVGARASRPITCSADGRRARRPATADETSALQSAGGKSLSATRR